MSPDTQGVSRHCPRSPDLAAAHSAAAPTPAPVILRFKFPQNSATARPNDRQSRLHRPTMPSRSAAVFTSHCAAADTPNRHHGSDGQPYLAPLRLVGNPNLPSLVAMASSSSTSKHTNLAGPIRRAEKIPKRTRWARSPPPASLSGLIHGPQESPTLRFCD